jgi:hypothetical protein
VKGEARIQGREAAVEADVSRGVAGSDDAHSTAEKVELLEGTVAALRDEIDELQRQFAAFRKQFE